MLLHHKIYPNNESVEYLFILHGLFGMLDNWHNMARKLSVHFNVVTVDLRNHGQSAHTSQMSFELMAQDLAELMDFLEVEHAHVLGHSMGGKVAMKFADLFSNRLSKLVVADIAPKKYAPGHTVYFEAFRSIDFAQCETRKEADAALAKIESNSSVRQFLLKNLHKTEKGYALKFNLEAIETFYPSMIDAMDFCALVGAETLFLFGEKSDYVTERDQIAIAKIFTKVQFLGIPDAGHWLHAEQPAAFYDTVSGFFNSKRDLLAD